MLVRTDLWRALGGFSPSTGEPGEDLDLSWRAHVAGARVIVAPQARVRHLEAEKNGLRAGPSRPPERLRAERERHRLRTLWTCYGFAALLLIAPAVVLFALAESTWAFLHRRSGRQVLAPLVALFGSLRRPRELWQGRRRTQSLRRAGDFTLWKLQTRGSARLRALLRLRLERGHELAWVAARASTGPENGSSAAAGAGTGPPAASAPAALLGPGPADTSSAPPPGPAPAAAELAPAPRAGPGRAANLAVLAAVRRPGSRLSWKATAATFGVVVVLLAIGSRNVLTQPLPLVGELPSMSGGVGGWWHSWWNNAGPGGLASSSFAPPGLLLMGVVGLIALGSTNFAVHILVFAPLLVGPWGAYAQTRPFGSQRGRLAAAVLYAALPVPFNALAQGHWAGLVAYAVSPWLIGMLCRLGGRAPYPFVHWDRAWPRLLALERGGGPGRLARPCRPAPGARAGPVAASRLPAGRAGQRGAQVPIGLAHRRRRGFGGSGSLVVRLPGVVGQRHRDALRRGARVGAEPVVAPPDRACGAGPLGWALVVAAAIPLFVGRSWRLAFAARLWMVAFACLGLAWAGSRGWFPVPPLELLLAPAGAALVLLVALGAASVEVDVPGYRFGWRQAVPAVGALAVLAVALPLFSWVTNGQWDVPASGAEGALAFPAGSQAGDYRILWLGSAGSLPLAAEGSVDGVAFATSLDGLPTAAQLWAPAPSALSSLVATDLRWAAEGETTALGRLFAPLAVRYIVVPAAGAGTSPALGELAADLARQVDLVPVGTDQSYAVFANAAWAPLFSVLPAGPAYRSGTTRGLWPTASSALT